MSCTQGREHTLYSVQTTRDMFDVGVEFLADSVSSSLYKPWEVHRTLPSKLSRNLLYVEF